MSMGVKKQLRLDLLNEAENPGEKLLKALRGNNTDDDLRTLASQQGSPVYETYNEMNNRLRELTQEETTNIKKGHCHCGNKLKKSKFGPEYVCYICIKKK